MQDLLKQELGLVNIKEFILLDVAEPLMTLVESEGEYYFIHLLQNRRVKTSDRKRARVYEILTSKTTLNKAIDFLEAKITFHQLIMDTEIYTIGKIANRIFPKKRILNINDIQEKLPQVDFCLEPLIPNRIDTVEVKRELSQLRELML